MTSPLRRKRRTTHRGPSTSARRPASLAVLAALLFCGLAPAQGPNRPADPPATLPPIVTGGALPPSPVQPALFQPRPNPTLEAQADELEFQLDLVLPGRQRIFGKLDSEEEMQQRMRAQARGRKPVFPESPVLSTEMYFGRRWPEQRCCVEPVYVCYRRLFFEQPNLERYGWDFGPLTPVLSYAKFLGDVVTLPYHMGTDPFRCDECNAGYCLPGDPVPFMLYPPKLSLTGAMAEVGTILTLVAIFP